MKKTSKKTLKAKKRGKPKRESIIPPLLIMVSSVAVFLAMAYFVYQQSYPATTAVNANDSACTQEAMLCPDGVTYVGRSGPNCEFAACPGSTDNNQQSTNIKAENDAGDLTTYTNATNGATISYDRSFVVTRNDENGIQLANSQSCADALKLPTTIIASGCVYPSFTISTTQATVSGTKAVTSFVDVNDVQWQKTVDETDQQSSVEIYQLQRDGKWFVVQAQYNAATGDGVDLLVSSIANSLSFEAPPSLR